LTRDPSSNRTRRGLRQMARIAVLGGCALSLLALAGCQGAVVGSELSARPRPRPISASDGGVLRLPADEKFSIHLAPSQQEPGLDGTARASADAKPEGDAAAQAEVENGGKAAATFQLGHALANDSSRQVALQFNVKFAYEFEAASTPVNTPGATLSLKLYARDGRNRVLTTLPVLEHASEDGSASSSGDKQLHFSLTLGPGESASVFLAGNARIEAPYGRSARGALTLRGLTMEIETRPAPPVKTAE